MPLINQIHLPRPLRLALASLGALALLTACMQQTDSLPQGKAMNDSKNKNNLGKLVSIICC